MAKQRIQNYVFLPGVSSASNQVPNAYSLIQSNKEFIKKEAVAYIAAQISSDTLVNFNPNAVSLLTNNKTFLQDEITAWITNQVSTNTAPFIGYSFDVAKCKRDVGYVIDAYIHDIRYGGDEKTREVVKQYWLSGVAQVDGDRAPEVAAHTKLRDIINNYILAKVPYFSQQAPVTSIQNLSGSTAETGVTNSITKLSTILTSVIQNGLSALPSTPTEVNPVAASLLLNNKTFLQEEITAWIANQVSNSIPPFAGYTYDLAKCKRDVGYVIDAYVYDVRFGGNEKTRETISKYWINSTPQIDGDRAPEVAAHTKLRDIINDYIFTLVLYPSLQQQFSQYRVAPVAEVSANSALTTLASIVTGVIQNGLSALPALSEALGSDSSTRNFASYIYDSSKCERDIGYVIDAYLNDLRYGGNAKTRAVASRYWDGNIPQIDGDRLPEVVTHKFIRDLIINYILPQNIFPALQNVEPQRFNGGLTPEPAIDLLLTNLSHIIINVIQGGLTNLPTLVNGVTTIKVQGKYDLSQLLLITNSTNNQILYNFADPELGGSLSTDTAYNSNGNFTDSDFPTFLQIADYITTITLKADTTTSSAADEIQIFVEMPEQKVRPYDFGTDAIERMRVATPQSMLDADFEYGLQPTKWQAIGLSRSYPSVYEVPGTDLQVVSVSTDASSGTGGFGQSLITVTTAGTHNLTKGQPITIRALANTISGFSRAEGTFLVISVLNSTQFTYYATAKVGTSPGQVLATTYTQLRKASFYTGASVGAPIFSVYENGTNTTITSKFNTVAGSDQLAFIGVPPGVGSPLSGTGIGSGAQVSGVVGPGGLVDTILLDTGASIGSTSLNLTNATGILEGLAIDNGSNTASFVSSVSGNTVNLTAPLTVAKRGNTQSFVNVSGTNISSGGSGAIFTINRIAKVYSSSITVVNGGSDYVVNDRVLITGDNLGGTTPANDLILKIESVNVSGAVTSATIFSGTSVNGDATYLDVSPTTTTGPTVISYTGLSADLNSGSGTSATFNINRSRAGYISSINNSGSGYVLNDLLTVYGTQVGGVSGAINTFTAGAGTSVAGQEGATYSAVSGTSATGTGATFTIVRNQAGGIASVTKVNSGTRYAANDTITILGSSIGGVNGTDNLTITVDTITSNDALITVSEVTKTYSARSQNTTSGSGTLATFNITRTGSTYTASIVNKGTGYATNDTLTFNGATLDGTTPANNFVVTVTEAGKLYNDILQDTVVPGSGSGGGALWNIKRAAGTYTVTLSNPLSGGGGYMIGDVITIFGTQLGGTAPTNNLSITVTNVTSPAGYITDFTWSGTASTTNQEILSFSFAGTANANGAGSISNVTTTGTAVAEPSTGAAAKFDIIRSNNSYTVSIADPGNSYQATDVLIIRGNQLGGNTPVNDLSITVTSVNGAGLITAFTSSGTGSDGNATFASVNSSLIAPIGSTAIFGVTRTNQVYSVSITYGGINYFEGERIKILGTQLGGATPANDATITINSVSNNSITSASITGTAIAGESIDFYSSISFTELTSATVPDSTPVLASAIATFELTFTTPHGLVPGASVVVDITSAGTNHDLARGPFYVEETPSLNSFRYTARAAGVVDTTVPLTGIIYARPDTYFIHRPYDGGVQLGTGGPQHGAQAIRMSKKYIRYQSGKGIMYTTGALFAPSYNLQALTASGTSIGSFITVETDDVDHGCQVGGIIKIIGVETAGYNGTYTVVDVINERTLRVQASTVLANNYATLGPEAQISIQKWHGATVRAGCFDEQNGMYWQYDGRELAVGRRTSTFQLAGVANIARDTNLITGQNTRFRDQIFAGDKVVIKGMTHTVTNVISNTQMTVAPDYRGAVDAVQAKLCLVQDIVIPQRQFNIDRLDGTGPSGYNVDVSKMQMIGLQYTWYGAGFIDYMLRGSDGNYIFCHRIRNSNVNTEAFMRTGNLPVRYEVINEGARGKLLASMNDSQDFISLIDASSFPDEAGTVLIDNELITFSGKQGNNLIGCTRAAPLTNFVGGAQRTFKAGPPTIHEYNTGVVLVSNSISPIISHWGSAFLTDGRFDEDRGYIFNYAATGVSISTTKTTAFLIRLAPSVSNAIVGDLGERELINRAQLLLKEIAITSDTGTGGIVIEGVLNPQNYPLNPGDVAWGSLQGLAQGGQPSFAQIAPGGSINWNGGAIQATATATTLNSINGNLVVPGGTAFDRTTGTSIAYVTRTSWNTIGASVGFSVTDSKFPSGTTVTNLVNSPEPVATTLQQVLGYAYTFDFTPAGTNRMRFQRSWWELMTNPANATGMQIYPGYYFPNGTTVVSVSNLQGTGGNQYYEVTFSANTFQATNGGTFVYFQLGGAYANRNTLYFTSSSWTGLPVDVPRTGTVLNDSKFSAGTSISAISSLRSFAGTSYYAVTFSSNVTSIAGGGTVTFTTTPYYTLTFSRNSTSAITNGANIQLTLAPSTIATNNINVTQASWDALVSTYQATAGTEVQDTKFPAGTRVASVSALRSFAGTNYYTLTFNQTSNAAIAGASNITFVFGQPPYALPGETVFSFISSPGGSESLDLGQLKELTNTTLGGRGTYPNGPDVLAINVYKATGTSINANIVLRWGEAQA